MKLYHARFYGRKRFAIGRRYWINAEAFGDTEEQARLHLYDRYEHITNLTLEEIENDHTGMVDRGSLDGDAC